METGTRVRSHVPPKRNQNEGTFAKATLNYETALLSPNFFPERGLTINLGSGALSLNFLSKAHKKKRTFGGRGCGIGGENPLLNADVVSHLLLCGPSWGLFLYQRVPH